MGRGGEETGVNKTGGRFCAARSRSLRVTKEAALGLGIELENSSSRRARLTVFLSTLTLSGLSTIIRPPKQVLNLTRMA